MINLLVGFAIGVIAGPQFLKRVWPRVVTWWNEHDA